MRVCKYSANIIKNSQKRAERPCFLSFFQHWSTIFPRNRYPEMTTVAQMFRIPHVCHEHIVISDVATQVGFNTPKYFSKCFKKEFGIFPKEYAEQLKGNN